MNKRYPELCSSHDCTGCAACYSVCPTGALSMQENERGFLHPTINKETCIQCLACEKTCPLVHPEKLKVNEEPEIYAAWNKDIEERMKSSSGGLFSVIARYVLSEGGYVWGAAYDESLRLTYQYVDNVTNLDRLRRSKYIQSEVGDAFKNIKAQLKNGNMVLFAGTPCHVRGLLAYIPLKMQKNLLTVDFICHGVPSPKVFKKYINWLETKYKDRLTYFNFRDKRYGWDNGVLTVGNFYHIGEKIFMDNENSFFYGMLHDMFIRDCCYDCKSNGVKRCADFTIADFWGIGRKTHFSHNIERNRGISLLALNSEKAKAAFNIFKDEIYSERRTVEEAIEGNWNYRNSANHNPETDFFWRDFEKADSWESLLSYFQPTTSEKFKLFIKRHFGPKIANKLRVLIGR